MITAESEYDDLAPTPEDDDSDIEAGNLSVLRLTYVRAYVERERAKAEATRLQKELDQARDLLIEAMDEQGESSVKLADGTLVVGDDTIRLGTLSLVRTHKERYACGPKQRKNETSEEHLRRLAKLGEWFPSELRKIDWRDLATYCKDRKAAGETLPDFIGTHVTEGVSIYGLKTQLKPKGV